MPLESLVEATRIANRQDTLSGIGDGIIDILRELQGLKFAVVTGATAATNIAVSGITTADTLVAVIGIDGDNATLSLTVVPYTTEASITSNGNIQLSLSNTSTYRLVVIWFDKA